MMKFLGKINRSLLAVLLTALTCLTPAGLAFAAGTDAGTTNAATAMTTSHDRSEDSTATDSVATAPSSPEASTSDATSSTGSDAFPISGATIQNAAVAQAVNTHASAATAALTDATASKTDDAATQSDEAVAAADPNTFAVSNADELQAAFDAVGSQANAGPFTITLSGDIDLSTALTVPAAKDVVLAGNGHELTCEGSASLLVNGTLTLNGPLTIKEAASHDGTLITVTGGTLQMTSGVALVGNTIANDSHGGAVYMTDAATFDMSGGVIEHFGAAKGGGVYIADSTPRSVSTFIMSGDATIQNNLATNVGGGVFVGTRSVFTMEGNASVVENNADAAGGVMNYGKATLTTVYNNTTRNGAADIYNYPNAMLKLDPTNPDWVLSRTDTHVTGWYIDNYHQTDDQGYQGGDQHRWDPALDDSVEYTPTNDFTREQLFLIAGAPLVTVTWENEDGTVLFTMTKGEHDAIPEGSDYNALSHNPDPTEPDANGYSYQFEGWTRVDQPDDDVLYIAEYDAEPIADATTDAPTGETPPAPQSTAEQDGIQVDGMAQTGDNSMELLFAIGGMSVLLIGLAGLAAYRTRTSRR